MYSGSPSDESGNSSLSGKSDFVSLGGGKYGFGDSGSGDRLNSFSKVNGDTESFRV